MRHSEERADTECGGDVLGVVASDEVHAFGHGAGVIIDNGQLTIDVFTAGFIQHISQIGVVLVAEDGCVVCAEVVVKLLFGAHDAFKGAEALEVCASDVGDQSVVGFGDIDQFAYVARV